MDEDELDLPLPSIAPVIPAPIVVAPPPVAIVNKADNPLSRLPSLDLLEKPDVNRKAGFTPEQLERLSRLLEIKLREFNIDAKVVDALPGPVVTRFEVDPAPGVKVAKISSIAKDLARSMAMIAVRVVEVIPGKTVIGIEVPNENRQIVRLHEILSAPDGKVTVNYRLAAPPWVSVGRIHVYVNGRMVQRILVDPDRSLADTALPPHGPVSGQLTLTLPRDSWIVLEAVGDRPMFPVVTGTEEPFLLVSDAVGALAGPLGIAATTDIGAVVVGNEQPYALTNPVWVQVGRGTSWRPPGVVPWKELNVPSQDPGVGVLRTRNHD